ncbi:MAG: hypothetical protein QM778_32635 [Myxococcales bacterium]
MAGGGVLLLLLLVLPTIVGPRMVLSRLRDRASRYGLKVEAEGVSLGLGGVGLEGLSVGWADSREHLVQIEQLSLDLHWFELGGGLSALAAARVEKAVATLTARDVQRWTELRGRLRPGQAAENAPRERSLPLLEVEGFELTLTDEVGPLLQVIGGALNSSERDFHGSAKQVVIGGAPGDAARLDAVQFAGELGDARAVLASASAGPGQLDWADNKPGAVRTVQRLLALRDALRSRDRGCAGGGQAPKGGRFALEAGSQARTRQSAGQRDGVQWRESRSARGLDAERASTGRGTPAHPGEG